MKTEYAVLGIVAVLAIAGIGGYAFLSMHSPTTTGMATNTPTTQTTQATQTKLADSPYANYAYLISGDSLSSAAQTALTGFSLSHKTLSNGDVEYTLTAQIPGYQNQTYTLSSGEKLYFIELTTRDDVGGSDRLLGDDHAIIVDANGYIVQ